MHTDTYIILVTELRALDLQTGHFRLRQIKAATNNFDPANKIGEGGFGPVYKVATLTISLLVSLTVNTDLVVEQLAVLWQYFLLLMVDIMFIGKYSSTNS